MIDPADLTVVRDALRVAERHYENEAAMTSGWKRQYRSQAAACRRVARQIERESTR